MSTRLTRITPLFSALILVGFGALAGPSRAQESHEARTLTRKLEKQKKEYAEVEKKAKLAFARYFDRVSEQVRRTPGLAPELKASKLRKLAEEKADYQAQGTMPESSEMLEELFSYEDDLHRARLPMAKTFDQLMQLAINQRNNAMLQQLTKEKEALDEALPGRQFFRAGTNWTGSRYTAKSTMRTRMRIANYEANSFRGHVWQGDPPEDQFVVEGTINGNFVNFQIVEMVRGAKRMFRYKGYVLQRRMVLKLFGIATDGKPIEGDWIQLSLK